MQTIWRVSRAQIPTLCNHCFAIALSNTLGGRVLEPSTRRYIQSLSLYRRTTSTKQRLNHTSRSASSTLSLNSLSPSLHSPRPSPLFATSSPTAKSRSLITPIPTTSPKRLASSSSKSRWKQRQGSDHFAREAKVQGLKSRAAFKLLEMDTKYKLFKKASGQIIVDLGFAPGSWSQVALERTKPDGYVLGIDLIPAQPPKGMNTIQGNFLSPGVQGMVKGFLLEEEARRREARKKARKERRVVGKEGEGEADEVVEGAVEGGGDETTPKAAEDAGKTKNVVAEGLKEGDGDEVTAEAVVTEQPSYIDMERQAARESDIESGILNPATGKLEAANLLALKEKKGMRLVDVVLSDMSAPWPQTSGFSVKSLSNPYNRMMNTSGNAFRDHVGSMDLCKAALSFASDTLKPGGHFICKFYQGGEDKAFENKLKKMFAKVHREKPESSRSESKESFFVALRRKPNVTFEDLGME
ncbi:ribosomal RNA large subunit methyltransferase [Naviculisporaceae sp. PSN 640]